MDESTLLRESAITDISRTSQASWGSIFAGWVLAAGIAWLFYELGAAVGLTVIDPAKDQTVIGKGLPIAAGAWLLVTWVVSLFLGGLFAGRLAGKPDPGVGMLHGMAVWSVTAILTLVLGAVGVAGLAQGASAVIGGVAKGGSQAAEGTGAGLKSLGLEAAIKHNVAQALRKAAPNAPAGTVNQAVNRMNAATLAQVSSRLLQGDTEGAKNVLAINTDLSRADVDSVIGALQAQVPRYKAEAAQQAQKATRYSAAVAWGMFVASVAALGAAIWGGALGARGVRQRFART